MNSSSSSRSDWSAFLALTASERRLLVATVAALPAITALLKLIGYRRLERMLARTVSRRDPRAEVAEAAETALATSRVVTIGASRSPFPSTCLSRSLTLWLLLRLQRIDSEVCLGVRRDGAALDAHAWVRHLGLPLNDSSDVHHRFVVVHPPHPEP